MEQSLAAMHQANPVRLPIHLGIAQSDGTVSLTCSFPHELRSAVEQQLFAHYPECKIEQLRDETTDPHSADVRYWTTELTVRPDVFPIKRVLLGS